MEVLNNEEMLDIEGGSLSFGIASLITGIVSGIVVFLIGTLDGF